VCRAHTYFRNDEAGLRRDKKGHPPFDFMASSSSGGEGVNTSGVSSPPLFIVFLLLPWSVFLSAGHLAVKQVFGGAVGKDLMPSAVLSQQRFGL